MPTFASRVFEAIGQFNGHLVTFVEQVKATAPTSTIPRKVLTDLLAIAERARKGSDAIAQSFTLIRDTALDIVDMQVRLQGETARLASSLRELEEAIEPEEVHKQFDDALVAVRDAAQLVGAAVFPSAVAGLLDVNVRLWDFEKLEWKRYTDILTDAIRRGTITPKQQVVIQQIADEVNAAFADVNTLLNDLAEARASDAAALRRRLDKAPARLTESLAAAEQKLADAGKGFSAFESVIKASKKIANDVAKLLSRLTIPVFPLHPGLGTASAYIDQNLYETLSGVQAFALLNILSRLEATKANGRSLLADRKPRVTHVFSDRIYLEMDKSILEDLKKDTKAFVEAPASLHKFRDGSYKQKEFKQGNLQVCYAARPNDRIAVDADIDLHRGAIPHLFGEVLINHLTGNTTDQYAVRKILDGQQISAIGGFKLLTATA